MKTDPDSEKLTAKFVNEWLRGTIGDQMRQRIESDLLKPDSEVRHYLDWKSGACPILPTPRIAQDQLESHIAQAGGYNSYVSRLENAIKEEEIHEKANATGLKLFNPKDRGR